MGKDYIQKKQTTFQLKSNEKRSILDKEGDSVSPRKYSDRQKIRQNSKESEQEDSYERSQQSSPIRECIEQENGTEKADGHSRDVRNVISNGLPEFIETRIFFKRPEIRKGRVGTLFFNYVGTQQPQISEIEDKINVFRIKNKWQSGQPISWQILKQIGEFTEQEIKNLRKQGRIKISASFLTLYQKLRKNVYHKMVVDFNSPSKMFCSFAFKDSQDESKTVFNAVVAKNQNVGFILKDIVDLIPEISSDIEQIMSTEPQMSILNAIQLLCIFKPVVSGKMQEENTQDLD